MRKFVPLAGLTAAAICCVVVMSSRASSEQEAAVASAHRTEAPASVSPSNQEELQAAAAVRPVLFEENGGRFPKAAKFVARTSGLTTWLTEDGFRLSLAAPRSATGETTGPGHSVFMSFEDRSAASRLVARGESRSKVSELTGPREQWKSNLSAFHGLSWEGIQPGIDVQVRGNAGAVEYDIALEPNASLEDFIVKVEGASALRLEDGILVAETPAGDVRQEIPLTFEIDANGNRRELDAHFAILDDQRFGFVVPGRSADSRLVIDPTVRLSTFLGGAFGEEGLAVACGPDGCIFVAGEIRSTSFPGYPGAIASPIAVTGECKSMVTKLNADGTQVLYTAVVDDPSGNGMSRAHDLKVLPNGDAIVAGDSWQGNFTTTQGAYQTTSNGNYEAFVYKVSADFSSLVFSTLLGGSGRDEMRGICCDAMGNIIVVGVTDSVDFPVAGMPLQGTSGGARDGFVAVLNSTGSALVRSTYLGGAGNDEISGCDIDAMGNLCLVGAGSGAAFPASANAYQATNPGGISAWVGKLSASGAFVSGTYFGGAGDQTGWRVSCCDNGTMVITGQANAGVIPTTMGSYDPAGSTGLDVYVANLSGDGTNLNWATYLGGSGDDKPFDLCVDADCNVYVGGDTTSVNFPVTSDAYDSTAAGGLEAFFSRISANGTTLDYSTYLGGNNREAVGGIFCCPDGNVCVTGTTLSANYPTMGGVFQPNYGGGYSDIFLNCFFFCDGPAPSVTVLGPGCNVAGDPVLMVSTPEIGTTISVTVASIFPNAPYWVFYSYPPYMTYFDPPSGCTSYVDVFNVAGNLIQAWTGTTDASGNVTNTFEIPFDARAAGTRIIMQARVWAPGGPLVVGDWLSNGLDITIGCP